MHARVRNSSEIENGSITVYLCLVLCVILSLVFACITSARISAGRAALSCAVEEGLFSLFSNYDKALYENYGLLFLDSGYGTGQMHIGALVEETRDNIDRVLSPAGDIFKVSPQELYGIQIDSADVIGYSLATDSGYASLVKQIKEIIVLKLGADVIKNTEESLDIYTGALDIYTPENEDEIDSFIEEYEAQKELAEQIKEQAEKEGQETEEGFAEVVSEPEKVVIPADFKNPVENITKLRKLGLMVFALPDGADLSAASIDSENMVSGRSLNKGMGMLPDTKDGITEKFAVSEFASGFFSDYLTGENDGSLQYQIEYIIGGKPDDASNLKAVMNRLLLVRFGMNYMYLLTSADKAAEIYEIASIISALLLMPEGIEIIAQIVKILWAYAESMMDVKSLLSGGKVPVFKDNSSWQVSLSLFSSMNKDTEPAKDEKGFSYKEYLRLLMYGMPYDELIGRTADMIEYNRRKTDENFRLDLCLDSFEIEFYGSTGGSEISINRGYSYNV